MLVEILCDKFISNGAPRGAIRFHNGLNVVQGNSDGDNSIGKSTFLLIIDFAFGGDDYTKQEAIHKEIGEHTIRFRFVFDGVPHFFSRSTAEPSNVNVCDENYIPTERLSLDDFRARLLALYKIDLKAITFRDIVGRYFRIYGRKNLDELNPLANYAGESSEKSVIALLKLYDRFAPVADSRAVYELKDENRDAMLKAQKFNLLAKITATAYKENLKRLEVLQAELDALAMKGGEELLTLDPSQAETIAAFQAKLTALKRQKNRLWAQYYAVKNASEFRRPATQSDFEELTKYFPNSDLRKLGEIENFHARLSSILSEEFAESLSATLSLVNQTANEIDIVEAKIQKINLPQKVSRATLNSYAEKQRQIDTIKKENDVYNQKKVLDAGVKTAKEQYAALFMQQIFTLQGFINAKMEELNDFIYGSTVMPPVLTIPATTKYEFKTLVDGGTGTNYKNLVILDLSALELTPLPALVHDTVIFKNIAVEPMGKIIELYEKYNVKQIFIAFDRTVTYPEDAQALVDTRTVLSLSSGGNELFGRTWSKKTTT